MGLGHIAGGMGMEGIFAGFHGKIWQIIDSHVDKFCPSGPRQHHSAASPPGNSLFLRSFRGARLDSQRAVPRNPQWLETGAQAPPEMG